MEAAERNRFPKSARLSLKKEIDHLFNNGQSFIAYPLRIVYVPDTEALPSESGIAILISVPKKRIKRAVDRNRIKRLIREAFRLNQRFITGQDQTSLHIACMYISNEIATYAAIENALLKALTIIHKQAFPVNDEKAPKSKRQSEPSPHPHSDESSKNVKTGL